MTDNAIPADGAYQAKRERAARFMREWANADILAKLRKEHEAVLAARMDETS